MKAEILYYPSIELRNENWVKRSLLYWDRICRIVPEGYMPNDSDFIKTLKDNYLIKDIRVSESQKINTAYDFGKFLKKHNAAGLTFDIEDNDDHNYRLHKDKVYYKLWDIFQKSGVTTIGGEWLTLPKEAIGYYMLFLANAIARSRRIVTGTDDQQCWCVTPYFTERGNFDEFVYNPEAEGLYCQLILDDILPSDVTNLTSADIIKFCNTRNDEKIFLREKINEVLSRLQSVTDREQIESDMSDLLNEIEHAKTEYKRSREFAHSGMPETALAVGVPVALTAISVAGANLYNPISLGASLTLGAIAAIKDYSKIKRERDKSYESYLVGISDTISRRLPIESHIEFEEFMND